VGFDCLAKLSVGRLWRCVSQLVANHSKPHQPLEVPVPFQASPSKAQSLTFGISQFLQVSGKLRLPYPVKTDKHLHSARTRSVISSSSNVLATRFRRHSRSLRINLRCYERPTSAPVGFSKAKSAPLHNAHSSKGGFASMRSAADGYGAKD
jgi:hypothetical protein